MSAQSALVDTSRGSLKLWDMGWIAWRAAMAGKSYILTGVSWFYASLRRFTLWQMYALSTLANTGLVTCFCQGDQANLSYCCACCCCRTVFHVLPVHLLLDVSSPETTSSLTSQGSKLWIVTPHLVFRNQGEMKPARGPQTTTWEA